MANNMVEFFGALKEIDWNEKAENIKNLRLSFNERLQKRIKTCF